MARRDEDERLQTRREPTLDGVSRELNAMPDGGWFYAVDGTEIGPVSKIELLAAAKAMPSMADVVVFYPGLTDWVPLQQSGLLRDHPRPPASAGNTSPQGFKATLFSFEGRLPRLRFLLWSTMVAGIYVVVVGAVLLAAHLDINSSSAVALRIGLALPFLWSILALTTKRLHDLGYSGKHLWWIMPLTWAGSLPVGMPVRVVLLVLSGVVDLFLICKRGMVGPNAFSPDRHARPDWNGPTSVRITAPVELPRKRSRLWAVGAVIAAAAIGLVIFATFSDGVPSCSDQGVGEKLRQVVADNSVGDAKFLLSGGIQNVKFSVHDVRTLSNDEPLNGRTCAATVVLNAKNGVLGKGDVGSEEVTFTVQKTDDQTGRYVVTVRR